uniref:Acyl_transf_3 domain-containing protein n=1 Tax=Angiostrongylus cantonensis TaxID=6313 RepID=A0A0K0DBX8_ANGCA
MNVSDGHRSDLQGIRAVSIVAVLAFHFYGERFPNGYVGVDQFFVLSGFLMSMMLERKKRLGSREIMQFYYRRVRRILPSYLLVVLLSLIASRFIFIQYLQASNWESAVYALTFTTNIKAADSIRNYLRMVTKASDLFTHTWSIALEMQFYLIFPFIFIVYKSICARLAYLFLVAAGSISLLFYIFLPSLYAFNMVHARLWQFVLGKHGTVCTFLTGGLILFHSPDSTSILSSKCFTYLGELSYSLYLVHWPIYTILKIQFPDNTMSEFV